MISSCFPLVHLLSHFFLRQLVAPSIRRFVNSCVVFYKTINILTKSLIEVFFNATASALCYVLRTIREQLKNNTVQVNH